MFKIISKAIIIPFLFSINPITFNNEGDIKGLVNKYFKSEELSFQGKESIFNEVTEEYKEELNCRLEFLKKWASLQNYKFDKFECKININEIRNNNGIIKVFIEKDLVFKLSNFKGSEKSLGEKYCIHVKEERNIFKISKIISEEENQELYLIELENKGSVRMEEMKYKDKIKSIDEMYREYRKIVRKDSYRGESFSRQKTIEYAEKYALNYNKEYKEFDSYDQGGDCTNFVSQCLYAGGLGYTEQWKPYTEDWILVVRCREYLVNNRIAKEYEYISPEMVGGVVQFYNIEKGKWAHSGIITHYTGEDYLFCCHSYDRLNYPLSMRYPSVYPKIRMLII